MHFTFTPQQQRLREELREFLSTEAPRTPVKDGISREFSQKLAERGWIGIAWPTEYGGKDMTAMEQMIFTEEMIKHRAPRGYHFTAERQVGPSLIRHGTEDQKREWIPRILNAKVSFALGLSEPEAGSDLAAVTTTAIQDGDEYVVNGQKIWTSNAHRSDMIWLVTRTDPAAPKHRGISCLMVDLDSPGITIRPLYDMSGEHHFNEVFFDDVRVPVQRRVGEENRGWYILAEHLDFERSGIERLIDLEDDYWKAVDHARALAAKGWLPAQMRARIAELGVELEVGRLLCYRVAWMQGEGIVPNAEASMAKVFGTEWSQRVTRIAQNLWGLAAAGYAEGSEGQRVARAYFTGVPRTIAGGTSEIQRNIIASRGLGLPRS